jgi:acyl carrier protein
VQAVESSTPTESAPLPPRSAAEIQDWLASRIAARLQITPDEVSVEEPLIDIGLDSMEFVAMVGELEHWLGCRFRDNPLIDYPTISALSEFLAGELAAGRTSIMPTRPIENGVGLN